MACRKNAYRGLSDMTEFLEKQNEEEARRQHAFDEEQRKIWTPTSLLEQCCVQWLACGPHRISRSGGNMASVTSRGCSGCLKKHPKITLDCKEGVATASISVALDPFVEFFKELPDAIETSNPLNYQLNGLLSNHHERIVRNFGAHLVLVEHKALAASQRAYERQLEQDHMKQAAKKRKVTGEAAPVALLDKVLEICYNHTLPDNLDLADIAWMRTSCKSMGRIAAWMARDRMRAIKLSYSPYIPAHNGIECVKIDDPPHRPLSLTNATSLTLLCPHEPQKPIRWSYSNDPNPSALDYSDPSHIRIEIYIDGKHTDIPESGFLFKYTNQLQVVRYLIDARQFREVGAYRAQSNVQNQEGNEGSLEYMVTSCIVDENLFGHRKNSGEMIIQSISFTFSDLIGIYVRRRLYKEKQKYNFRIIKKPADRAYIKALAKAARESPGNASSFEGMKGWTLQEMGGM